MKTILVFNESTEKRKVILKHKRDIRVYREQRADHIEWEDAEGNRIETRSFIVIRVPKDRGIDFYTYRLKKYDRATLGFRISDHEDYVEILFYDRVTFAWNMYDFEVYGLFRASQRMIPDFEEHGEIFPCYINPRGLWEVGYDLFFGLLQLPFTNYKERKRERLRMQNKTI